jgi:outer membrane protein assembly factor BamB
LYVGHGDSYGDNRFGYLIFSLIDGSEMLFINGRDPFAKRSWGAFDGNPVFDKENDRMILPGENGVIYSILLNTKFDREAATIAIDPVISRYCHTGSRRLGTENSMTAFSHFAFFADNSGLIQCLDLKTLEPVWFFDAGDDTDASLVLEWEEANQMLAIYTGIEVDLQGPPSGIAVIRKLNAANGSVLWTYSIPAFYSEPNGGVVATPVTGKNDLSHLVFFKVCKLKGREGGGVLIAFDKQTGDIVWEKVFTHYGWSSPAAVYNPEGAGYLLVADSEGNIYMIRGTTGEIVHTINTGELIEASPAVFGNMMVLGTRDRHIYGIRIF